MRRRSGVKVGKSIPLLAAICFFLFSFPTFSLAHAYIKKSTPSENEILEQSPKQVTIHFDETLQPAFFSIQVFDSNGGQVDEKNGRINPENSAILECDLKGNLPIGTYRIEWKAVSGDGHPVQGVIPFQIGTKSKDRPVAEPESSGYTPSTDLIILRWLQYVANACFVGILFFYLFVLPKDLHQNSLVKKNFSKVIESSFLLLCLSIVLSLPLQATIESSLSWGQVFSLEVFSNMLANTVFGKVWIIAISVLLVLVIPTYFASFHQLSRRLWMWMSVLLGMGLLLTKSLTSHAASSTNEFITVGMDFLHLLSASIWIGSLVVLTLLIPLSKKVETKEAYMEMIRRFSKWGIVLVVVLSLTGVFGSYLYIPNLRSLLVTDYGRALSGKVILLIIMILLAAVHFFKGKRNSEKGLAPSLWAELSTGLIVLILSVILTNLPTAMASPGPIKQINKVNGNQIIFEATPNIIGKNTYKVSVEDPNGQPIKELEQVTITFTSLEMDMGKDTITLSKAGAGKYVAKGFNFSMSGKWNVHVHVLTKELETMDTDFTCLVGSQ